MTTRTTTQMFSDSLVARMMKTEHPLLIELAKRQNKRCDKSTNRAYTIKSKGKQKGQMTFLPKGKACVFNEDGNWDKKNRQEVKLGSGLRYLCELFKLTFKDAEFEQAVYCLQAQTVAESAPDFRLIKGPEINKWYNQKESPISSCMKGANAINFDLYESNPNIGLLVLVDKKNIMQGRAIVYNCSDGKIRMSRIYDGGVGKVQTAFMNYAKERGWIHVSQWGAGAGAGGGGKFMIEQPVLPLYPYPSIDGGLSNYPGIALTYGISMEEIKKLSLERRKRHEELLEKERQFNEAIAIATKHLAEQKPARKTAVRSILTPVRKTRKQSA